MKSVLIVGYGVVGHNLSVELGKLRPDVYDKYKEGYNTKPNKKYDFCFICVDTPFTKDNVCDTTEVLNALNENEADVYIIKSTVLPQTTDKLVKETGKTILFSPEYYGGTQHCNNFNFDFTILGGDREACTKVVQLLQDVYDGRHVFKMTDAKTAELTKYMENSFLGMKVTFCIEFYEIAQKIGVDYEELRELFLLDERVNRSHTFVYKDHPYYDSHCLNKDIPAIAYFADSKLLKTIIDINEERKNKNSN